MKRKTNSQLRLIKNGLWNVAILKKKKDRGQVQSSFIVECWDQYYSKPVADRLTEAQLIKVLHSRSIEFYCPTISFPSRVARLQSGLLSSLRTNFNPPTVFSNVYVPMILTEVGLVLCQNANHKWHS